MRLSKYEIESIKNIFSYYFEGEIYLFGSRIDDNKKGGDIDLYLVINNKNNLLKNKIKFLARLKKLIGDRKIDVVFNEDENRLIEKEAKKWGIKI